MPSNGLKSNSSFFLRRRAACNLFFQVTLIKQNKMLKLIVFDCDGVMFDSKNANIAFYNHLLSHFGCRPMDDGEEDFVHMNNVADSVNHIFRHYSSPSIQQVHTYREQCSYEPFLQYMHMEEDLVPFLETTRKNCHLAISTNRTNTMLPLLKTYKLDGYFDKVVTAATATRPKPAPDGLIEILEHFQCSAEEAIFIGDSIFDEQHAAGCNVPLIAFRNNKLHAKYYVESFTEILKLPPFQA